MRDTLSTIPPALPELRHDAVRLGWEERRLVVEARIAELEARHG